MKKSVRSYVYKRLGLGLIQHFTSAFLLLLVATILFHSYLTITTMNGRKTYSLDPLGQKTSFEESEIFQDLYQTSVKNVIRLAVIRNQIETGGSFDPSKKIDVTAFMKNYGTAGVDYGKATATYKLEDLLLWNRYGLEYKVRSMSLSEFVNYFDYACWPGNFKLDEYDNLVFIGYNGQNKDGEDNYEEQRPIIEKMNYYVESQLEDMAFEYIMKETPDGITLNREDDGNLTVYINVLYCKYPTMDHKTQLYDLVDNWPDFIRLQKNIAEASQILSENYELYQNCARQYAEGKSNLKYVIRMKTDSGPKATYSNVSEIAKMDESSLTEYFEENNRYLIYFPNSLEIMGNSEFSEANVYGLLREAHYPRPEEVYIWISLDSDLEIKGDIFSVARNMYENIVPNTAAILTLMIVLAIVWITLLTYLTVTAGMQYEENDMVRHQINLFDKIWTEVFLAMIAGAGYAIWLGIRYLRRITLSVYDKRMLLEGGDEIKGFLYQYGIYALFGFAASLVVCFLWYSLVRRLKALSFYRDSLLKIFINGIFSLFERVLTHQSSLISALLPYTIFLMINFSALIAIFLFGTVVHKALILAVTLIIDIIVGVRLFQKNAEFNDIIDGINRIRSGEVEYKLDSGKLRGMNKLLADAVNNIGEGIDNAVKTSMKDERLKTDLITNVSHDLKTPLTSIINYVDLLKRADIQDPQARNYVEILDGKSQRLKDLTDDLVEASKISSGNIVLNMEVLNLGELLKQTIGELSEKLEGANLKVVAEIDEKPALIYADSRRMWRVMENLFNNICKYAMEGTRVYAEVLTSDDFVDLQVKNVSRAQMNIHADELTERFIRGDSSRSTEGSGLGLYIAKSLTNVLGGTFEIQLDGDLFKVQIRFPKYVPAEKTVESEKKANGEEKALSSDEMNSVEDKKQKPDKGEEKEKKNKKRKKK